MDILLLIAAVVVIVIIYFPVSYLFIQQSRKKAAREKFFKAANSILQRNPDDQSSIAEFMLAYKKTVQFNPSKSFPYKNAADFIEELIYAIDTLDVDEFKSAYGFIRTEDMRTRLFNILTILKQMSPYASVSTRYAGLLETLNKALNGGDAQAGKMSLNQLTESISTLENAHQYQTLVNVVAITTAAASLVLALVLTVVLILR
jgi:hypothetical protein